MSRTRRLAILAACLIAVIPVFAPSPALAAGTGEIVFECEAHLPAAPPTGPSSGTCGSGVIPAQAEVSASGVFGPSGLAYIVAGHGRMSASFDYWSVCAASEPPVIWGFSGTATVPALSAFANGEQTRADLVVHFTAQAIGTEVLITVTDATFSFWNGGTVGGVGLGEGQFLPVLTVSNTCPSGGPLTALVHGEVGLSLR